MLKTYSTTPWGATQAPRENALAHPVAQTDVASFNSQNAIALPFDQMPVALSLALQRLKEINQSNLSGPVCAVATQPFNAIYGRFINHFAPFTSGRLNLLPGTDDELKMLACFSHEMAIAYKQIVKFYLVRQGNDSERAQTIYLAMYYLGQFILHNYEQYSWVPPRVWRDLHRLYTYAERKHYLNFSQYNPVTTLSAQSIGDLYAQVCIVALSDPYQLKRGDVWAVYSYCRNVAPYIEIMPPVEGVNDLLHCYVQLNGALRPFVAQSAMTQVDAGDGDYLREFTLKPAIQIITEHTACLRQGGDVSVAGFEQGVDKSTAMRVLGKLIDTWQVKQRRQRERVMDRQQVIIAWGLPNIHTLLSQRGLYQTADTSDFNTQRMSKGYTANTDAKGMGFLMSAQGTDSLDNGQVVAIVKPESANFEVGFLRWTALDHHSKTQLNGGIELLSGSLTPMVLIDKSDELFPERQVLLVTTNHEDGQTIHRLLLNTHPAELNDRGQLLDPLTNDCRLISIDRLHKSSGIVCEYHVTFLDQHPD